MQRAYDRLAGVRGERARGVRVDIFGRGISGWIAKLFDDATRTDRRAVLFLVALCLVGYLPGFAAIPPIDRTESRVALASQRLIESDDPTYARLGNGGHARRVPGIHALQEAAVTLAQGIGVPDADRIIAVYRLPSLVAAIAAVLLTFWAGLALLSRRAALLAATLLATCAALMVEARLARAEAVVLAATVAAMGAMARAYLATARRDDGTTPAATADWRLAAIFWGAIAFGLWAKGPMALVYPALAALALGIGDRSVRFLRPLAPLVGAPLLLALLAFWLWPQSVSTLPPDPATRDLIARIGDAGDGFGAPPGAYLLAFWGSFWPAAPLALLAVPVIWRARRLVRVRFLLAWLVPAWLLLEMLPTKIPYLVLPTFPAVALLIALAVQHGSAVVLANRRLARALWAWPAVGALIAVLALLALAVFDRTTSLLAWPLLVAGFLALVVAVVFVTDYGVEKASLLAVAGMLVSGFGVMQLILPRMESAWVASRLVDLAEAETCAEGAGPLQFASAGYAEPSFAFLMPGRLRFVNGTAAAEFLAGRGCRVVFVERRAENAFARRADALGLSFERGADISGYDYAAGRRLTISLYRASGGW
ncbi:ArnT family glycosyltransferase [Ancylobacter terrae]|uniref:ArnT family glycosyltransferase n=1 Tax=Ancylobacter sp. sgz301288 TaxID=3342077 RepID=UPI00385B88A7